jgi:HPt (histidine-containing phosphotransfer) domain-containing protein
VTRGFPETEPMSAAQRAEARPLEDDEDDFDVLSGEYEIIPAKQELKKKAQSTRRKKSEADVDPVAAAEAALEKMAQNFVPWMASETETLLAAWQAAEEHGFDDDSREVLYRAAHDIKGQAATLGFPLVGHVAKSLCHLLDHVPETERLPTSLVAQHVQAIRAMVAENARETDHAVGRALHSRLSEVTDEFIASLN